MTAGVFSADEWIDRLARALPGLAEAQEPYLQEYYRQNRGVDVVYGGRDGDPPDFPLDDLRDLYLMGHHGNASGEQEYYAPLCAVLDLVRSILRSHPTLERVVSRMIGRDEFWMEILSSGSVTSLTNLIAGLMARAAELSGDRFRAAAGELNAFLTPAGKAGPADVLGGLDIGSDAVLFYGLTLKERIDIADGMAMLPFEQARAFVDENMVTDLARRAPGSTAGGRSGRWSGCSDGGSFSDGTVTKGRRNRIIRGRSFVRRRHFWKCLPWRTRHLYCALQRWPIASTGPPAGY